MRISRIIEKRELEDHSRDRLRAGIRESNLKTRDGRIAGVAVAEAYLVDRDRASVPRTLCPESGVAKHANDSKGSGHCEFGA